VTPQIYHRILNDEESESGVISTKPRDVDAHFAVTQDPVSGQAFFQRESQNGYVVAKIPAE
jgi:hypothetical protein